MFNLSHDSELDWEEISLFKYILHGFEPAMSDIACSIIHMIQSITGGKSLLKYALNGFEPPISDGACQSSTWFTAKVGVNQPWNMHWMDLNHRHYSHAINNYALNESEQKTSGTICGCITRIKTWVVTNLSLVEHSALYCSWLFTLVLKAARFLTEQSNPFSLIILFNSFP